MKLLIICSKDSLFVDLAIEFKKALSEEFETFLVVEDFKVPVARIIKQRINRAGLFYGLDQFLFKAFDVLILRYRQKRKVQKKLKDVDINKIGNINSKSSRGLIASFDIVVCLATSIVRKKTIDAAQNGIINVHPGILPMYRGIGNFWAVINKDWSNIGCTCHWMSEKIDDGLIITITKTEICTNNLWGINANAIRLGFIELASVINSGAVMTVSRETDLEKSRYYSWNGFFDYMHFIKNLKVRKHLNGV